MNKIKENLKTVAYILLGIAFLRGLWWLIGCMWGGFVAGYCEITRLIGLLGKCIDFWIE